MRRRCRVPLVHFPPDVSPAHSPTRPRRCSSSPGANSADRRAVSRVGVVLMPPQQARFSSASRAATFPRRPTPSSSTTRRSSRHLPPSTSTQVPIRRSIGGSASTLTGYVHFVAEALADQSLTLDVFAYDFDEPDIIRQLGQLGPRLRLYLDNSASHIGATAREPKAHDWLTAQGAQVKVGHFQRFSHDKVLIQTGRRGAESTERLGELLGARLYVQSNNAFTFDDQATAALYEQAFQQSWDNPSGFATSQLAGSWHDCGGHDGLPGYSVCLSPHNSASVSLDRVAKAVTSATSSVLFAIMEIGAGTGPLLDAIRAARARALCVRHHATTRRFPQVQKSAIPPTPHSSLFLSFNKVPAPFRAEWTAAGPGHPPQVVVTDSTATTRSVPHSPPKHHTCATTAHRHHAITIQLVTTTLRRHSHRRPPLQLQAHPLLHYTRPQVRNVPSTAPAAVSRSAYGSGRGFPGRPWRRLEAWLMTRRTPCSASGSGSSC